MTDPQDPSARRIATTRVALPAALAIRSDELLKGRAEVLIIHRGETYRLCLTRSGKLILQK